MKVEFDGYKVWKHIKRELNISSLYILPSIIIITDNNFDRDEYPIEIEFSWLFWKFHIYLCI